MKRGPPMAASFTGVQKWGAEERGFLPSPLNPPNTHTHSSCWPGHPPLLWPPLWSQLSPSWLLPSPSVRGLPPGRGGAAGKCLGSPAPPPQPGSPAHRHPKSLGDGDQRSGAPAPQGLREPLPQMTRWGPPPQPSAPDKDTVVGTAVWAPGDRNPLPQRPQVRRASRARAPPPRLPKPKSPPSPGRGSHKHCISRKNTAFLGGGGGCPHTGCCVHTRAHTRAHAHTPPETSVLTNTLFQGV